MVKISCDEMSYMEKKIKLIYTISNTLSLGGKKLGLWWAPCNFVLKV